MTKSRRPWVTTLLLALLLLFLVAASAGAYFAFEINQPKGRGEERKEIIINAGTAVREIAERLKNEGLIRNATFFILYIKLAGLENEIEAGRYEIPSSLSIVQIAQVLRHGTFDIRITFLEGWRREEYLEHALRKLPVEEEVFSSGFLAETKDLEGYLFPDTYLVAANISAKELVALLKENFEKKYAQVAEKINMRNFSEQQAVILASIIEREAKDANDAPIIAGILIKRLNLGWTLDVDATVQYALGPQSAKNEGTWWKPVLDSKDLNVDSPYNTRRYQGLPPGPIANPGVVALRAVAEPQASEYLYYLHDKKGDVHFANTLQEHNANVVKYLR